MLELNTLPILFYVGPSYLFTYSTLYLSLSHTHFFTLFDAATARTCSSGRTVLQSVIQLIDLQCIEHKSMFLFSKNTRKEHALEMLLLSTWLSWKVCVWGIKRKRLKYDFRLCNLGQFWFSSLQKKSLNYIPAKKKLFEKGLWLHIPTDLACCTPRGRPCNLKNNFFKIKKIWKKKF